MAGTQFPILGYILNALDSFSPPLGPPVLKPGLDLRVRHLEVLGEGRPLGGGEVLLLVEALLQLADLDPAEGRPRLLPLGRRPVLVGVSDPPPCQREGPCKKEENR